MTVNILQGSDEYEVEIDEEDIECLNEQNEFDVNENGINEGVIII
jgi:hypothetical protein